MAEDKPNNSDVGDNSEPWEFAGWGVAENITDLPVTENSKSSNGRHLLGSWRASAICGNDIASSCLYVSALCAAQAGKLAPFVLLIVAAVLYMFRKIYAEVGSALPLNGGTYTVLLNTTNKRLAAAAACLTLLSYMATAVISANEAIHYLHSIPIFHNVDILPWTVVLLATFAFLTIWGIGESAIVALVIFITHLVVLTMLSFFCIVMIWKDSSLLQFNFAMPSQEGFLKALFFGFAAAMLGISGFESSANFIEEQKDGVFPKTLRNMWIVVAIFNPLISFLSFGLLPMDSIKAVPEDLLSQMGTLAAGQWLGVVVSIDAVLVLSGAVLTSYVGVTGLVRRMSLDRCMPQFLLKQNKARKTNHWIIICFFVICISVLYVTGGNIKTLAGVYTLSFLSVMALFAIGNMLLKVKRGRLPRNVIASWPMVTFALIAVIIGIVGNTRIDPAYTRVFSIYYFAAGLIVAIMFLRMQIMRLGLFMVRGAIERVLKINETIRSSILFQMKRVNNMAVVYFTGGDSPETLNNAALYVQQNEQTNRMIVIHVYNDESDIPPGLSEQLKWIDHLYPRLRIDFLAVKGSFGPDIIEALSERLNVPKNYMFIGTPGDRFPHRIEKLGGVRLIL